jgi:PKD repeat protein
MPISFSRRCRRPYLRCSNLLLGASLYVALLVLMLAGASRAAATGGGSPIPAVPAYGEVHRFGGLASGSEAQYGVSSTTGVPEGKFVDPLGMAVDTDDPNAGADKYAIYVLENTNPQALNALNGSVGRFEKLALEYRIQKLDDEDHVLGTRSFTLESSEAEPGLHAVALAVDGQDDRVYVLIADAPGGKGANPQGENMADRIDAWTTGRGDAVLAPAVGLSGDELPEDSLTHAGELVGPAELQTGPSAEGPVDGVSLAVDGTGAGADLALGGTRSGVPSVPAIERIVTKSEGGKTAGQFDGVWDDSAATEDEAAKAWQQKSEYLDSLSADPDGSLNVTLGPRYGAPEADEEPNMARVSADLTGSTQPILPWADAKEGAVVRGGAINRDRAATVGFTLDNQGHSYNLALETGATGGGGTLGPAVVGLAGDGTSFPTGLYAGVVANEGEDEETTPAVPFAWGFVAPSSLAIRVFDEGGHSLAMIGNTTQGGLCNLQGGPGNELSSGNEYGSFVALAAGREGTVFALTQSNLYSGEGLIAPGSAIGAGMGDEVVEFAPGAGQECPQPSGGFSITNKSVAGSSPSTGTGPVTVPVGTELEVSAASVDLQGSPPWAYDWNFEDVEETEVGGRLPAGVIHNPWFIDEQEHWTWASPIATYKYTKTGSYEATLKLVNDFGTLTAQREVKVVEEPPCHAVFTVSPGATTVSQPVSLDASNSTCEASGDTIKSYEWDFGDSTPGESLPGPQEQHLYATEGEYQVKLTITDSLGRQFTAPEQAVSVTAPSTGGGGGGSNGGNGGGSSGGGGSSPSGGGLLQMVAPPKTGTTEPTKVLTKAQKLAEALKVCKKKSKKQRAKCEAQARKQYGPPAKPKKSKKKK